MSHPPMHGPAAGSPAPGQLVMTVDLSSGHVRLVGRLDRRTVHHLLDAVRALSATDHPRWSIDAAALESCDATAVRALGACYRRARGNRAQLRVVAARPFLVTALSAVRVDSRVVSEESLVPSAHPASTTGSATSRCTPT
ncbi:STAS domain-containing protein [Geodermatophilus sp. SYSU D00758]